MKRWSVVVGALSVLAGCGLFQVRVNGETKTLGGSSKTAESESNESSSSGQKSSNKQAKSGDEKKKSDKPSKDDKEKLEKLHIATREIRDAIDKSVMEDPGVLPADKITQLEAKKKEFAGLGLDPEVHYLDHVLGYYKLENAWRGDAAKSGDALAAVLGGKAHAQGEVVGKDKPQTFKFKAEEGKCYTVLLRLKTAGGEEDRMTDFFLDAGKENAALQRFDMDQRSTRGAGSRKSLSKSYTRGACALKSVEVTAQVAMTYAGTQNALRYVVVETPRDAFPKYIALEAQPRQSDSCDIDGWVAMFTNPIPGTVLYGSEAPYVPYDVGQAEEMWMTSWSAGYGEVRVKREDLSSAPPKQFKFNNKLSFKGCPKELKHAHSTDGLKVAQCYDRLDKKFDPQYDAANKARDNAVGYYARYVADRRITQLNDQYSAEEDRTCNKLEAEVEKKFEAAYNKIVDFYSATPVKSTFDRGKELKLTSDGAEAIGCAGRHSCSL